MEEKNMTALVSCFARAYHSKNYKYKIFDDFLASKILSQKEYDSISLNMKNGIKFFNPNFKGTPEEALRYIVDNQLSPSVLGRSVFTENELKNHIKLGFKQYLIFAAGYDTFAYRNKTNLEIFEIDKKEIIEDKINRLDKAKIEHSNINFVSCDFTHEGWIKNILDTNYDKTKLTFCSLLGISYYLTKEEFENMIEEISKLLCNGSTIVFDYPTYNKSEKDLINQELANEAKEKMKSKYTINDIEIILDKGNFLLYENLTSTELTNQYFYNYNTLNPNNNIIAPSGVNYCLAVKKD